MKKNIQKISITALLLTFSMLSFAEKTLCKEGEYTYFSCQLTNGKYVSFCSPKKDSKLLSYRYGKSNKIEFDYSKTVSDFSIQKKNRGELTPKERSLIREKQWVQGTEKKASILFVNDDIYVYQFDIEEFLILPNETPSEVLDKDTVYTKIDDKTYIKTFLTVEHRIQGSRYFEGQCKQGVGFRNLFKLKSNTLKGLEPYTDTF